MSYSRSSKRVKSTLRYDPEQSQSPIVKRRVVDEQHLADKEREERQADFSDTVGAFRGGTEVMVEVLYVDVEEGVNELRSAISRLGLDDKVEVYEDDGRIILEKMDYEEEQEEALPSTIEEVPSLMPQLAAEALLTSDKDTRELITQAIAAGAEVVKTKGGHLQFTWGEDGLVYGASTPSDVRSVDNLRAQMRRRGLDVGRRDKGHSPKGKKGKTR